jgi:ADP-ribosylglycohydrolase
VIRAAPHGIKAQSPREAAENAWVEAGLTHPSWEARTSSALVAGLVAHLVEGARPSVALEVSLSLLENDADVEPVAEVVQKIVGKISHEMG